MESEQEKRTLKKVDVVYICQMVIVYIIIITSVVNLSLKNGSSELWISLLCSATGYALPAPSLIKRHGKGPLPLLKQPEL